MWNIIVIIVVVNHDDCSDCDENKTQFDNADVVGYKCKMLTLMIGSMTAIETNDVDHNDDTDDDDVDEVDDVDDARLRGGVVAKSGAGSQFGSAPAVAT